MKELIKRLEMELEIQIEAMVKETGEERIWHKGQVEALQLAIEMAKEY